ncbi:peptidylprolyl isomerase [Marinibaculum pumilum]|uniref:Parvulin-like PPIase n=1 Tax=Marinibaculum pumilum TaxID=1766165 RepID=A0ABV7KTN0_9PROT
MHPKSKTNSASRLPGDASTAWGFRLAAILALLLGLAAAGLPQHATAQQLQRIVAVVNDEVISAHDMEGRLDLVVRSANLPDTKETRQNLRPQILRTLIDERLQLQEAEARGIEVTEEELQNSFAALERNNNMQPGTLDQALESRGIDKSAVAAQVKAEIAWGKLLRQQVLPRVQISDQQVQNEIKRWQSLEGQTEYHLAEILLIPDSPEDAARAGEVAQRLVEDMRKGARFSVTAQQFSQGPTAAAGGDIGWVDSASMLEEVRTVVEAMPVGALTDPIEIPGGWTIIFLRDKRIIGATDGSNSRFTLAQLAWAAPEQLSAGQREAIAQKARAAKAQISGCGDVEAAAKAHGADEAGQLGQVRLADLPPQFRQALQPLKAGDVTDPVDNGRGFVLLVVCNRVDQEDDRTDPEKVRERLANDRIGLQARRYLRDLRRDALIEIRN